jgi:membrane-associated phospholipid phosphatase
MPEEKKMNPSPVESPLVRESLRRRAVRRLLRAETLYAAMLTAFAVLAAFAYFNAYFGWDLTIERGLQNLPVWGLQEFMSALSVPGNKWKPFALTSVTTIAFFVFGLRSEAAGLVLSAGGSALLNGLIKLLIARPRPTSELVMVQVDLQTQSFPSGHVTFYVCYFGFLFFVAYALLPLRSTARRAALTLTVLPVALIGFSRVYLGAHWPSDTLGAYLMGGLWLAFSLHMYRIWKERATFHPEETNVRVE